MCFCETNRIGREAICDVTSYVESGYERVAQKTNPVRLGRNEARGGVAMVSFRPHFSGSGGCTKVGGWGHYPMALVLESSAGEWYATEIKVDLNQGVVR